MKDAPRAWYFQQPGPLFFGMNSPFFFFFQPFHMNTALCRLKGLKGVMAKMGDTIGVRVHNR